MSAHAQPECYPDESRALRPPCPAFLVPCAESIADWTQGAEHWTALQYWHAHESWEVVWRRADATRAPTLRACIQLAAALYKPSQAGRLRALNKPECAGLADGMRRLLDRAYTGFDPDLDPGLTVWFRCEWQRADEQWRAWNATKSSFTPP
jgi:hypothetical protein